jgi:hypothetical protein
LIVLTMMLIADRRLVGTALLVFAIIPFGDMSLPRPKETKHAIYPNESK